MRPLLSIAILAGLLGAAGNVHSATDGQGGDPAGTATEQPDAAQSDNPSARAAPPGGDDAFDVKGAFRNVCSFCHQDYGRKAGRGPQLMNSERSDQFLFDRIKHGMAGRMPGFGGSFSDEQIREIVEFIRKLKPGELPADPA